MPDLDLKNQPNIGLFIGFLESDGCLSFYWEKDCNRYTLVVSVSVTQKVDTQVLYFINLLKKGSISKNGNWVLNRFTKVNSVFLPIFESSVHCLYSEKFIDLLIFQKVCEMHKLNQHLTPSGLALLIDLKQHLHAGKTRQNTWSSTDLEKKFKLALGSTKNAASDILLNFKSLYQLFVANTEKQLRLGTLHVDPWLCTGFTGGDGSLFFSLGRSRIIMRFSLTTNNGSKLINQIVMFGITKKYIKGNKVGNDAHRCYCSGLNTILYKVRPHFSKYQLPPSKKKDLFILLFKAGEDLLTFKKLKAQNQNFDDLANIIKLIYFVNPTPRKRKYPAIYDYLVALKENFDLGKLTID